MYNNITNNKTQLWLSFESVSHVPNSQIRCLMQFPLMFYQKQTVEEIQLIFDICHPSQMNGEPRFHFEIVQHDKMLHQCNLRSLYQCFLNLFKNVHQMNSVPVDTVMLKILFMQVIFIFKR